jgi:hypothetical protein
MGNVYDRKSAVSPSPPNFLGSAAAWPLLRLRLCMRKHPSARQARRRTARAPRVPPAMAPTGVESLSVSPRMAAWTFGSLAIRRSRSCTHQPYKSERKKLKLLPRLSVRQARRSTARPPRAPRRMPNRCQFRHAWRTCELLAIRPFPYKTYKTTIQLLKSFWAFAQQMGVPMARHLARLRVPLSLPIFTRTKQREVKTLTF